MQLRMWTYDLAREQAPSLEHMRIFCDATVEAGYNAIGLYLEHRFAHPSTPWAHGQDCLRPEVVTQLQRDYPNLQIIPFVNLLGHFEGMIYTEYGKRFREERFQGMQACPSCPEFVELARAMIDDTISIFKSEIIHIGGDETWQLGRCPKCQARGGLDEGDNGGDRLTPTVNRQSSIVNPSDGKAVLYGQHFGPLAHHVVDKGRRPAVWGDMYLDHPQALDFMPPSTLIFDWQYFKSPVETSRIFQEKGFEVVCCPTLHTYNAPWLHLAQSEQNVGDAVSGAKELDVFGICVTTWECALFGNYVTLLPSIRAAGKLLASAATQDSPSLQQLRIEPTPQLPDPHNDDGLSLAIGIADNIVMNSLHANARLTQIAPDGDNLVITQDGADAGSVPLEIGVAAVRRLCLMANIELYQARREGRGTKPLVQYLLKKGFVTPEEPDESTDLSTGEMKGTFRGEAFSFAVELTGDLKRPTLRMWNPEAESRAGRAFLETYHEASERHADWARLMGIELEKVGGVFAFGPTRSSLKVRLLLQANPFLAWLHHAEELCGEIGTRALAILEQAASVAPDSNYRGVSEFVKSAINFVRYAEQSRQAYANGLPGVAASALAPCRQIFENLEKIARANHLNSGGSLADIERCKAAREHVERVIRRIKEYGDGSLGYLPAFELITHPSFVPHDQAAWWLINKWARE